MQITINGKQIGVPEQSTISTALKAAGETVKEPDLGRVKEWIHNKNCPMLGLVEVDGVLTPAPALKWRHARDGMNVNTKSEAIDKALAERGNLLKEKHECHFVRIWQKLVAVESENVGRITFEEWEKFSFPVRGAAPSIIHDPNKCVRCRACEEICRDIQGIGALSFDEKEGITVDENKCVRCGQCIHHCPMGFTGKREAFVRLLDCMDCPFSYPLGAMREVDETMRALEALEDENRYCVAEFAPAVRASIGEEFGLGAGELTTGKLYAALRRLGFKKAWDTNFAADLTIMEEGTEFIGRVSNGGVLPMFTSCSPGWIRFTETFFPQLTPNLSTAKSPQQMFGAVAKTFGAKTLETAADKMFVISIMPCTAKKAECARPEMSDAAHYWHEHGQSDDKKYQDVDMVLTTRELARLLKMKGINLAEMPEEEADPLLGQYTGAAPIFGRTGGVMEAALRTALTILTGEPPKPLEFDALGASDGVKRGAVQLGEKTLKVAVVHGLANARKVCESVSSGGEFSQYHFIEFMTCPGGCIGGGGQPIPTNKSTKESRTLGLNKDDREVCTLRMSHENPEVKELYEKFFEKPNSEIAHHLLHTSYTDRSSNLK